jgi:hypothetical protein
MKEIIIYLPRVTPTFFEVEEYGLLLGTFIMAAGGRVWAGWARHGRGVEIRIQGLSRREVRVGTQFLIDSIIDMHGTLSLVEQTTDAAPLPDLTVHIPWGTVLPRSTRLTKRLFSLLPRKTYVVSRSASNGRSVFAERLGQTRDDAWRRAVAANAVGRVFYLAWTAKQYNEERHVWPQLLPVK